jgi:hypothetical protein
LPDCGLVLIPVPLSKRGVRFMLAPAITIDEICGL